MTATMTYDDFLDHQHTLMRAGHRIYVGTYAKKLYADGLRAAAIKLLRRELGYTVREAKIYLNWRTS